MAIVSDWTAHTIPSLPFRFSFPLHTCCPTPVWLSSPKPSPPTPNQSDARAALVIKSIVQEVVAVCAEGGHTEVDEPLASFMVSPVLLPVFGIDPFSTTAKGLLRRQRRQLSSTRSWHPTSTPIYAAQPRCIAHRR